MNFLLTKNTSNLDLNNSYKFHLKEFVLVLLMGLLSMNLVAQDSLRPISATAIRMFFPKKPKVYLTGVYKMPEENCLKLKMAFGKHQILNKKEWINDNGRDKRPREVDVVMTLYPSNEKDWVEDYSDLINNRIQELQALDSAFLIDKSIKWNLYLQDKDQEYSKAKSRVHGLVIRYSSLETAQLKSKYNKILQKFDNYRTILKEGKKLIAVTERNKDNWKKMLIITDCTGSTIPYGTEVLLWHMLKTNKTNINQFSFFNDGDQESKAIGNAGGVNVVNIKNHNKISGAINYITNKGVHNNDIPENDIEAILTSIEETYDFEEIILIADNNSGVRDISLANQIKHPVRIVLCGVYDNFIHPDYFELAYQTKGSIHTVEEDIYDFVKDEKGKIIKLKNEKYKVDADDGFIKVKKVVN